MSSVNGSLLYKLMPPSKFFFVHLFSIFTLLLSLNGFAANGVDNLGRADYDLDDNGLIEINDLADLDEIRNNLDGKTLYSSSIGCPDADDGTVNGGCIGFELTVDLDFDTNGNGEIDNEDLYRNINSEGLAEGWKPIGHTSNYFNAHFNGNGYVIKNLTIIRPETDYVGLFGAIQNARIEQLAIAGASSEIIGRNNVAALIGYSSSNNQINNVLVAASVKGVNRIAELVGYVYSTTTIENSFVSGSVFGDQLVGGLVGLIGVATPDLKGSIRQVLSTAAVLGDINSGGLIGYSNGNVDTKKSYWAKDASGQVGSAGRSEINNYVGLGLVTLQCAIAENTDFTTGCVSADGSTEGLDAAVVLYKDWDPEVWDFGIAPNASQQLPGLKFNGQVLRDSDGDGSLDEYDVWPNNYAASKDLDVDGYPDAWSLGCDDACILASGLILDQFPQHTWAAIDADFDGRPDGTENCTSECELGGLIKDGSLGDYDNDGILDAVDTDEDNDGIDDIDANHNGLVEIDSLDKLNAMRFQLQGVGLQLTDISNVDSSGCPRIIYQGTYQQRCTGYELTQDLDFDTNADGQVDSNDDYWNENAEGVGEGWEPVGNSNYFSAHFNGNGHVIKNLTINRPATSWVGLFGRVSESVIENVAIAGLNSEIIGKEYVAALVGRTDNTQIRNVVIAANVQGDVYVAGLVGRASTAVHIENSFVSGSVSGNRYIAGLVGRSRGSSNSRSSISQSLSTSSISGNSSAGGLVGYSYNTDITNSYWATDISGKAGSSRSSEANSYVGLDLVTLQCAAAGNTDFTTGCVSVDGSDEGLNGPVVLYKDWDAAIWDFGIAPNASQQLPGLKFNGQVLRDGDGDGLLDAYDPSPFDHDNDGIPDEDDAFLLNSAAAIDDDSDGQPDTWNAGCTSQCQSDSGLILDALLNDTDNDGATNDVDSDFENDNGKPILFTVPEAMYVAVNSEDAASVIIDAAMVEQMLTALSATDVVDTSASLVFKVYLNDVEVVLDDQGQLTLPSGLLALNWVAVDLSGNESEPLEQLVYIYPQVRFKLTASITGEASQAEIIVELTGDSPEYPVTVKLQADNALSSIEQADVNAAFDLTAVHTLVIALGDDAELLNREARLLIPILEDNISENEELLVVELQSVMSEQDEHEFIILSEQNSIHELTVTDRNLAPTVQLIVKQNNQVVTSIISNAGVVTLTAVVADGNGLDEHTFSWSLDGINTSDSLGDEITFDPINLAAREYSVSVTVTDNGLDPLSAMSSQKITIVAAVEEPVIEEPVIEEPEDNAPVSDVAVGSSGGSSGGGAMGWMLFLLMSLALLGQPVRVNYRR